MGYDGAESCTIGRMRRRVSGNSASRLNGRRRTLYDIGVPGIVMPHEPLTGPGRRFEFVVERVFDIFDLRLTVFPTRISAASISEEKETIPAIKKTYMTTTNDNPNSVVF